ncbi:MAG: hypothetical protein WCR29_00315 [Bacteroidales bacterium]
MKRSKFKLLLLFIGLVAITGTTLLSCKDDEEDNNNAVQVWECKTYNNTTLTLTMYPKEGKFYTILSDTTIQEPWLICFPYKGWTYFYMANDSTMFVTKSGDDSLGWYSYGDHPQKWIVRKPSSNKMDMFYCGGGLSFTQFEYEFYLKKSTLF